MEMTKTTLNLPTHLIKRTKVFAAQNDSTMTDVVISGIEQILNASVDYRSHKPSLLQFLKDAPSPFRPMTEEERDAAYKKAMEEKHGSNLP